MRLPQSTEDLISFQSLFSLVLIELKGRGMNDRQISDVLGKEPAANIVPLIDIVRGYVDDLVENADISEPELTQPEMVELANRAVTKNLNEDGSPKYGTAQGYACALTALGLFQQRHNPPGVVDEEEPGVETPPPEPKHLQVYRHALELFGIMYHKYGEQEAAEEVLYYITEQGGFANLESLGISEANQATLRDEIIAKMKRDLNL